MSAERQYKNNIKYWIKHQGYKMYEVAEAVAIPSRTLSDYCSGQTPIPRKRLEDIASFLECPVENLEGQHAAHQAHTYQGTSPPVLGSEAMDRKRRELLHLLSLAGSTLILPLHDFDWERIETAYIKPSLLGAEVVENLEAINSHYWHVYLTTPPRSVVLDGVLGQLKTLTQFLRDSHVSSLHQQLCMLASDLGQLAGEIFFDLNQYSTAQSCYTFAASAAKEAKDYDLWACALVRNAFLPLFDRQYHDALPLLQEAQRIARYGDATLVTRFWVAAVEAEAYAGVSNLSACQRALDWSAEILDVKGGFNGTWLRFDGKRLPEQRGACFTRLERPDLALPALQEALQQLPGRTRRRGMVLTDMATILIQQGEIEQACLALDKVVEIAIQSASGMLRKGIYTVRTQLEPFMETSVVKSLDKQLALLD